MRTRNPAPDAQTRPAEPIVYGRRTRFADYRAGRRDGLARIPSLAEVAAMLDSGGHGHQPTPYLQMLLNRGRDMVEHERLRFVAATATGRTRQAELQHRLGASGAEITAAEQRLIDSRAELTEIDLVARHAHEEHHSEAFLRSRRENQRRHRIAVAESDHQRCLSRQHALHDELAGMTEAIASELAVARLNAVRIFAYINARIATYWEGLVLAHRDGAHLAALQPHLSPRLPDWVTTPQPDVGSSVDSASATTDRDHVATGVDPAGDPPESTPHTSTAEGTHEITAQPLPAYR